MTNTSFKLIFAALAATAALAGCTKEITPPSFENDKVAPAAEGIRVITVSFAPQTKTSFSETAGGIEPYFVKGDKIVLYSDIENPTEENTQTCEVDVDPETNAATITTKLSGALTAYYPESLVIEGKKGLNIYVPSDQDGTFDKANICSATIAENVASTTFNNIYALFVITPPAGTKKLTIKSLRPIGADGQRSVTERPIICGTGEDLYKITVGNGTEEIPSTCYVAMNDGVNLSDLSFEATSDAEGTTGYIKGITTSAIAAAAGTGVAVGSAEYDKKNEVKSSAAYTIDGSNWHDYVEFAGYKWATMNIGANAPEEYGDYFAWGDTVGHSLIPDWKTKWNVSTGEYENVFSGNHSFEWSACPFTNGVYSGDNKKVFTKYVPTDKATEYGYGDYSDSRTVLDLCDDAAYVKWGGAWRMPTKGEVEDFLDATDENYDCVGLDGCFYFQSKIKVPCSGYSSSGTNLIYPATEDHNTPRVNLWSSSLSTTNPSWGTILYFDESSPSFSVSETYRCDGATIRAIVDDPD